MDGWSDECPSRGAALSHAHWRDCQPPSPHPGTTSVHQYSMCCHCEQHIVGFGSTVAQPIDQVTDDPMVDDHQFIPTLVGVCLRCKLPLDNHRTGPMSFLEQMEQYESMALPIKCSYNHATRSPGPCSGCGVYVEPKLATGKPTGKAWGVGRGEFSARDQQRVIGHVGWRAWLAENGGGEQC